MDTNLLILIAQAILLAGGIMAARSQRKKHKALKADVIKRTTDVYEYVNVKTTALRKELVQLIDELGGQVPFAETHEPIPAAATAPSAHLTPRPGTMPILVFIDAGNEKTVKIYGYDAENWVAIHSTEGPQLMPRHVWPAPHIISVYQAGGWALQENNLPAENELQPLTT